MDTSLAKRLARSPVIATLYGAERLGAFVKSAAGIAIVANIEPRRLQPVLASLPEADRYAIVNIDCCDGLSQDRGGVDYLAEVGAKGIVSTPWPRSGPPGAPGRCRCRKCSSRTDRRCREASPLSSKASRSLFNSCRRRCSPTSQRIAGTARRPPSRRASSAIVQAS